MPLLLEISLSKVCIETRSEQPRIVAWISMPMSYMQVNMVIWYHSVGDFWLGKGAGKKPGKVWSFARPPSDPPPWFGLFTKQIDP